MNIVVRLTTESFTLQTAERPVRALFAELPLPGIRTITLAGEHVPWLCKQTKLLFTSADRLTVGPGTKNDEFSVLDLLHVSPAGDIPLRTLRELVVRDMDVKNLAAHELCKILHSRPLPIEDMTIKLVDCRNVRKREIEKLANVMTVLWDKKGEVQVANA